MSQKRPVSEPSDQELVRLAKADPEGEASRRAACMLLSRHRDRVYAWCYRRLGNADEALDAAQEVLLSAYRHLSTYEPRGEFGTWLYTIARNRCVSQQRRPSLIHDADVDPDLIPDPANDPAQILVDRMSEEALLDLIRSHLDPLEQEALWLRCFEQMPVERITAVLGIRQSSGARGVLQRARRRMREALARTQATGEALGDET